ncbi:putative laccase-9 [Typha latifolia]|uniref:putative laccase-9 n=1 Tax=Typha latifolia TaxID=4733 RepID=UPI003C2BA27D
MQICSGLMGLDVNAAICDPNPGRHEVEEAPYTRLCRTKRILTVNGKFPGQTLYVEKGDTMVVKVSNHVKGNITIHWHGAKQPRNPWSDGPAYITQCPIHPGGSFNYTVIFSTEEGTLWWHAHNDFNRATIHGAIVVYPKPGTGYPYPRPDEELVIILGEWWKEDVDLVFRRALETGGNYNRSDAYTINGQPGDVFPCSSPGTFRMLVEHGKTYLLRVVNAAMSTGLFFAVSHHRITIVGSDGSYTKPLTTDYMLIFPGETMDFLLEANQSPNNLYYMAARAFQFLPAATIDNTTTTAILEYLSNGSFQSATPLLPQLPYYNDTAAATNFTFSLRSLASEEHPIDVPSTFDDLVFMTVSVNELACRQSSCAGPNGTRLAASLNNISFVNPAIDILQAYHRRNFGVFGANFPSRPPYFYNFTAEDQPLSLLMPSKGTEVRFVEYGRSVEVVFQGTSLVLAESHPMHLHGYSFYVIGWGFGNFDKRRDPLRYNLKDPPLKNTIGIPRDGWVAIRFAANNPGVWFLHCHLERHMIWGMDTVFIVKDGAPPSAKLLPPPPYMPPCS